MTFAPARTLYGKLVLAMLALFILAGAAYVALTVFTARLQRQEVSQTLNQAIAANIVKEQWLMRGAAINLPALKKIFTRLMEVNPAIEVYLLDNAGRIISYSAPPEKVLRARVALGPIMAFLAEGREFPIRGDDPRDRGGEKIFSVAPIYDSGKMAGFLYIVLGGQEFDSVVALFQSSQIFRLSAGMTVAMVVLAVTAGALAFNWLTRRLRRLSQDMASFRGGAFGRPPGTSDWRRRGGDEIDRLGLTFEEMSRRIAEQIGQLRQADQARRDMVAAISHDLRTPLASLQGYLETLEIKGDDLSAAEKQRYLALALGSGERLSRLIADLFELATLEANDARIGREAFPINELASDIAQKYRLETEKKELNLATDIAESVPLVAGDIGLMERVFDNLIGNAVKYTPAGGTITVVVEAAEGAEGRAGGVRTVIRDTGPGIAAEDLPHVFERFYQADKARGRQGSAGAGLGLAIAQRIVQLHGGEITVDAGPETGTAFSFLLPAAGAAPAQAIVKPPERM